MPRHGFCWTKNNYTQADVLHYSTLVGTAGIKYICWGEEVASTGTKHLQGYLQANHHIVKRLLPHMLNAHIERSKGSSDEGIEYTKKDKQWVEYGIAETLDRPQPGKRTDLSEIQQKIKDGYTYEQIVDTHIDTVARCPKFIKDLIQDRDYKRGLDSLREAYASASLKPWQAHLLDILKETPSTRTIYWIWDRSGNTGKSWMTNYLAALHGATVLSTGKKADLAYIWANKLSNIAIFDLARTSEEYLTAVYSLAEDLKNGRVISTKYDSRQVLFPVPHVVCFANFTPDMTKWSQDRYFIKEI